MKPFGWIARILEGPVTAEELAPIFPWAQSMIGCPHDPVYHSEGDPWIHTAMVAEELELTGGFKDLPRARQEILRLGVWLHDIAKPLTTVVEYDEALGRERVRQPGHAPLGAMMAWQALLDGGLDPVTARDVHALVFWHQRPTHLYEQAHGSSGEAAVERRIIRFGHEVTSIDWSDLLRLCSADQRGRRVAGKTASLDELELAQALIEDLGRGASTDLLTGRWPFANPQTRLEYLRASGSDRSPWFEVPHKDKSRLIVLSGLPGSGKNTLIRKAFADLPVVSFDDIRAEFGLEIGDNQGRMIQEAFERIRSHLRRGEDVVWNATCLSRRARQKICGLGHDYGAQVEIHSIDIPYQIAMARNSGRKESVPQAVMEKMARKREPSSLDEAQVLVSWDAELNPRPVLDHPPVSLSHQLSSPLPS